MVNMTGQTEPEDVSDGRLAMIYPTPARVSLPGLYLAEDLRALIPEVGAYVYTNFITSLDGRIAVARADSDRLAVPRQTANARDWRLLLELAAPADAIVVSGRYIRQLADGSAQAWPPFTGDAPSDLLAFRSRQGLAEQPALVILSRSLELPLAALERLADRRLAVATVDQAPVEAEQEVARSGAEVLRLGSGSVDGRRLLAALDHRGIRLIYSTAGPEVLHMLLSAGVLQRLYLTTVLRMLAGDDYATLVRGARLVPPYDFQLSALYLDQQGPDGVQQLMQVYDRRGAAAQRGS